MTPTTPIQNSHHLSLTLVPTLSYSLSPQVLNPPPNRLPSRCWPRASSQRVGLGFIDGDAHRPRARTRSRHGEQRRLIRLALAWDRDKETGSPQFRFSTSGAQTD